MIRYEAFFLTEVAQTDVRNLFSNGRTTMILTEAEGSISTTLLPLGMQNSQQ